jgi:hypothetical protein
MRRISNLLSEGRIDPSYVEQTVHPTWFRGLSPDQFRTLLEVIAGRELRHAMLAVRLLDMWLFLQKPIETDLAEFAWKCLELTAEVTINDSYHCDHLAAELAKGNPGKGFGFLEKILQTPWDRQNWRPTDRYDTGHAFWEVLSDRDHRRALQVVLDAALHVERNRYFLTQDL